MNRVSSLINEQSHNRYLTPLFWQHGEAEAVLREEIQRMHVAGMAGFIVEARPHPDYLGPRWWQDMGILLDEAKRVGMTVWFFDDGQYPSGTACGRIRDQYPQYLKVYLREQHIDPIGPLTGSSFYVGAWVAEEEQLVRVVAARRVDGEDLLDGETLVDLTERVVDGVLYWDVPDGAWRVFIFVRTREGGEAHTRDYLNPLEAEPVRAYLDLVYEEHYRHFGDEFGTTIGGFFSDEPRFGNAATYEGRLGHYPMVLPFADSLLTQLSAEIGDDFARFLPCLWYAAGDELTARIRYAYMNVVSRLYGENFTQQIGDWCRAHGVRLIGHVVEDNFAHARLGYGSGHFFRAIAGQDASGFDYVYQVWPEYMDGRYSTPFGYLYTDVFHWGLGKMASSAGHLDPKKAGTTVCELFGAYGWQEGLKLMKWVTDHACVRGANFLIPHAFSPREFPDPDCPPHFYARGHNPEWRYFHRWAQYANRVCHLLSGGTHVAPVAVLYHAEAEWAGQYEPFEPVVKTLALHQIDCDVLPTDTLLTAPIVDGALQVNNERYRALIVPYAEFLPAALLERLPEMADAGLRVMMMENYPSGSSDRPVDEEVIIDLWVHRGIWLLSHDLLPILLSAEGLYDIKLPDEEKYLRYYHYEHPGESIYFFTNESRATAVDTTVTFWETRVPVGYDAMENTAYPLPHTFADGQVHVDLHLEPYTSLFVIFADENIPVNGRYPRPDLLSSSMPIDSTWAVSTATAEQYPDFQPEAKVTGPGNVARPGLLPTFSGTIRYETSFDGPPDAKEIWLDLGEVYEVAEVFVNEQPAGVRICPPYRFNVTDALIAGENGLRIEVTNTLAKQQGGNTFDRAMPQEPSGLVGPVRLVFEGEIGVGQA